LGICEGAKEDKPGWSGFLRHLVDRGLVIIPENKRFENWTSPALIKHGERHEEIEIYRRADPGDP